MNIPPDFDDFKSSRKTLYASSLAVFLLATLNFESLNFDLIGIKIAFEEERMIALGRLATLLFLIVFVMRALPSYIDLIYVTLVDEIAVKHEKNVRAWEHEWNDGDQYEDSPAGDLKSLQDTTKHRTKVLENSKLRWTKRIQLAVWVSVDLLLPFTVGVCAVVNPSLIDQLVIWFA